MSDENFGEIAQEIGIRVQQVRATVELFADGGTVPFIARYRKEVTGSLDEVQIAAIRDSLDKRIELAKRRDAMLKSLQERDLLTPELATALQKAQSMSALEDIYHPHRAKRRTKATIAKERGLEPLAARLLEQDATLDVTKEAQAFVDPNKDVPDVDAAVAGARDIIAEYVSDDAVCRAQLRERLLRDGVITSRLARGKKEAAKSEEGAKFRDYFDWSEPLSRAPSHRVLALLRGEREGFLSVSMRLPEQAALSFLHGRFVKNQSAAGRAVRDAVDDGYDRLLAPSLETEARTHLKAQADAEAIAVFADNLRELLLAAPLGQRRVLALDPGFRTGCKLVCLDRQGTLVHHTAIYPHNGERQQREAANCLQRLCSEHEIEAIAIGNGTAGRETERFVRSLDLDKKIAIVLVNESGASIYSASEVARDEFPDLDLTVRGAISIGRRLMDPLAELVKLDPKSIGVGQYQHDVDQKALKRSLDDVVMSCVNGIGVDVNSASPQLLAYVAGLGPQIAQNVVAYRTEKQPFTSRAQLKKVPRLGPKAFEQCAGFLRITDAKNPLDSSAVHPERYGVVEQMASDLSCKVSDLLAKADLRQQVDPQQYVAAEVGLPTLHDILEELSRPGRDPRAEFAAFSFADGVESLEDLATGMQLPGIVTNVTAFGAFVDVGVHQDGLVHVSQLTDTYVSDPAEVVKVQQQVQVRVLDVDLARKRISLSMRSPQ
ncbi:MAG: Tex family protein [Planctomycetota bacterium]